MRYEYVIYHSSDLCAEIVTEEPIPHLQVGNHLLAETYAQSLKIGESPVIKSIETYIFAPTEKLAPQRIRTTIYLG